MSQQPNQPSPERIFDALTAYQKSAALKAAIDLDLFTGVGAGHVSVEALAKYLQASPRGVRILCDYMVTAGFLSKNGNGYELTPESATFLDRKSRTYIGGAGQFLHSSMLMSAFSDLDRTVRRGTSSLPGDGSMDADHPAWEEFARSMMPLMFPAAQFIADMAAGSGPRRVLDIAAGHGLFGITIAQRNPSAHVVAVDWRSVLNVAEENARAMGVADRYSTVPGDAFKVDFGGDFDLALITNFLHHFDPPTCETLLRRIHGALKPGGQCVTLEFVPNEDRVSPPMAAAFALTMLSTTPAGDAYTLAEYTAMFRNAGFTAPEQHSVPGPAQSVLICTRI